MDSEIVKALRTKLKFHSRAIGIPDGAANSFIDATITSVQNALRSKTIITNDDLTRLIVKELRKYHPDLAYVYQNYDKII